MAHSLRSAQIDRDARPSDPPIQAPRAGMWLALAAGIFAVLAAFVWAM